MAKRKQALQTKTVKPASKEKFPTVEINKDVQRQFFF